MTWELQGALLTILTRFIESAMVCFLRRKAFSIMSRSPTFSNWIDTKASGALTRKWDIWAQGEWMYSKETTQELSEGQEHLRPHMGHCPRGTGGSIFIVPGCFLCWCVLLLLGTHVPKACTDSPELHSPAQCLYYPGPFVSSRPNLRGAWTEMASQGSAGPDTLVINLPSTHWEDLGHPNSGHMSD